MVKRVSRRGRFEGAKLVERRGPVTLVWYVDKKGLSKAVLENIEKLLDVLKEKGYPFKVVEIGTIATFWLMNKRRGRFIPLSIRHAARLSKR